MTSMDRPTVSAVIPTRNRPELVLRAVYSALKQTFQDLEVLVVIDGPDSATLTALQLVSDRRLRVIALPDPVGACIARNSGVRAAHGKWVAFLDDDDEWLPEKIVKQLALATKSRFAYPIVSSQLIRRTSGSDEVWPRKAPTQPLSEYLLARDSWTGGDGNISTITIFAPRQLFGLCQFRPGLKRYQEWDWFLRCVRQPGAGVEFVPEPLAIWHIAENRPSVGSANNWELAFEWIQEIKEYITPRAYAGFIATSLAPQASAQKAWHAFFRLLREMTRNGAPKPVDYALYMGMWLPKQLRRRVARLVDRL